MLPDVPFAHLWSGANAPSRNDVYPSAASGLNFPAFPCMPSSRQSTRNKTMVVRAGREFLAIPGPTTVPDEVLRAMHRPALDIYSDQMIELTHGLLRDLSRLF